MSPTAARRKVSLVFAIGSLLTARVGAGRAPVRHVSPGCVSKRRASVAPVLQPANERSEILSYDEPCTLARGPPPSGTEMMHVELDPKTRDFYCYALGTMKESGIPFLVGGAYALARYTGIERHTKDL